MKSIEVLRKLFYEKYQGICVPYTSRFLKVRDGKLLFSDYSFETISKGYQSYLTFLSKRRQKCQEDSSLGNGENSPQEKDVQPSPGAEVSSSPREEKEVLEGTSGGANSSKSIPGDRDDTSTSGKEASGEEPTPEEKTSQEVSEPGEAGYNIGGSGDAPNPERLTESNLGENFSEPQSLSASSSSESAQDDGKQKIGRFFVRSKKSKISSGGKFGSFDTTKVNYALLKKFRNIFSVLRHLDGDREYSVRYDWEEFVVRLRSFQSYQKARKQEAGEGNILLLVDVSGSCSGFCDKTLMVAKTLKELGENIYIQEHSNGWLLNGQEKNQGDGIFDIIRKNSISLVIALGDWDAERVYSKISQMQSITNLFWLDNDLCNYLNSPRIEYSQGKSFSRRYSFVTSEHPKTTYVIGCKDAEDFCRGIELCLRKEVKI